jgi:hypothetical protein
MTAFCARIQAGYKWPPYRRERLPGITVWRAPLWVPKFPGGLTRIVPIVTLADDPALMAELGKRARAWAEAHFERDAILGKMFASLHDKKSRAAATAAPLPSPDDQVMTISE